MIHLSGSSRSLLVSFHWCLWTFNFCQRLLFQWGAVISARWCILVVQGLTLLNRHVSLIIKTIGSCLHGWDHVSFKHDPSVIWETVYIHIIKLFSNLVDASKDDHVVSINACCVTRSGKWDLVAWLASLDFLPGTCQEVKLPEIVELLRIIVLASEHIHAVVIENCRVAWTWAWCLADWVKLYYLPSVSIETEFVDVVHAASVLVTTEYVHQTSLMVYNWCMFISLLWYVSLGSNDLPLHLSQVEHEQVIVVRFSTTATINVHVFFVNNWSLIGHLAGSVWTLTICINLSPAKVSLSFMIGQLQILNVVHVKFIHRVHWSLTYIKSTKNEHSAFKYKGWMVTATFRCHLSSPELIPVFISFLVLVIVRECWVLLLGSVDWLGKVFIFFHVMYTYMWNSKKEAI